MEVTKEILEAELEKSLASQAQVVADFNVAKKAGFMEGQIELLQNLIRFMAAPTQAPELKVVQTEEPSGTPDANESDQ